MRPINLDWNAALYILVLRLGILLFIHQLVCAHRVQYACLRNFVDLFTLLMLYINTANPLWAKAGVGGTETFGTFSQL